ncbi:MAG TPA: hypothetical protein VGQ57_00575 [Polyangiaceae bacterium]|jgi:hypothetical protein|nr:hypothetical protein [Polyangiaceae bacterium]
MSDMLLVTLSLFASIVGYLARPIGHESFALVKATHPSPEPTPNSSRDRGYLAPPLAEPAFDLGFASATI